MTSEIAGLVGSDTIGFVARSLIRLGAPREDVDDLTQEVLLIAIRRADSFDRGRALEPWLWGIARHRLRDHRKLAWNRRLPGELGEDVVGAPPSAERDELLAIALQKAISRLGEEDQLLIVLHDLEEWTLAETGVALGMSSDTAKYRLGVARSELRRMLKGVRDEEVRR